MNLVKNIFIASFFIYAMAFTSKLFAQGPPPPPPPPTAVPIDGGILALLGLGAAFGIKKIKEKKSK